MAKNETASSWVPGLPLAKEWHARASSYYHDTPECTVAQAVPFEQRRPGSAGRPRCPQCAGEAVTIPPGTYATEAELRDAIAAAAAAEAKKPAKGKGKE